MEKKSYINPECIFLEMKGKYGLLDSITISSTLVNDGGDIGFSKEHEFEEEEENQEIKNLWED